MTYGLMITNNEMNLLEENNVEYLFWDIEELINDNNVVEVEFETKEDFKKAKQLLDR